MSYQHNSMGYFHVSKPCMHGLGPTLGAAPGLLFSTLLTAASQPEQAIATFNVTCSRVHVLVLAQGRRSCRRRMLVCIREPCVSVLAGVEGLSS